MKRARGDGERKEEAGRGEGAKEVGDQNGQGQGQAETEHAHAPSAAVGRKKSCHKRQDYISWDEYFMGVAFLSAMRSKDPSTQVGAVIVSQDKRIVGAGYNGFPSFKQFASEQPSGSGSSSTTNLLSPPLAPTPSATTTATAATAAAAAATPGTPAPSNDDVLPWTRQADNPLDTKYYYVVHAEANAILNKISADVRGCSMYVGLHPCHECAKLIIQSGIREVVYVSDKHHATPSMQASRRLLHMAGIVCRQYIPPMNTISVDFRSVDPAPETSATATEAASAATTTTARAPSTAAASGQGPAQGQAVLHDEAALSAARAAQAGTSEAS